jgi:4-amino-4-deoxy-L-arabinose transferase-like glycosyltransferase
MHATWLLLAALPVFFLALDANSIWDANEAFYVETPRQMVESGDYVTPTFNDAERVNKPVLSYWIVAGLYQMFGVSVGVERLGIALGALAIIAAAFLIGRALRSPATGVIAALILATAPRLVMHGRRIFIDIYITAFMALTLACFVLAERHPEHRRRYLLLMYGCIGMGMLTKGPIALVLPGLVCALWFTFERRWADVRRLALLPGLGIVLAVVVPWYAAIVTRHGWGPVTGFFLGENVDRYLSSMVPGDARPFWFYLPVLFSDLFPWALLLIMPLLYAAPVWVARRWPEAQDVGTPASIRRLLWWWIVAIVVVFSLSETKQDLYIFPVVPAVAALVADVLVRFEFGRRHRGVKAILAVAAMLSAVAGGLIGSLFRDGAYALDGAGLASAVLVGGGVLTVVWLALARERTAVLTLAGTFVLFNYVFVSVVLPSVERFKPTPAFAGVIAARGTPDDRVGSYHYMLPSLVYYANRPVVELDTPEQVRDFYSRPGGWVMMRQDARFEDVRREVPGLCVADSRPVFEAQLGQLLDRRLPGRVLLVTNRCP